MYFLLGLLLIILAIFELTARKKKKTTVLFCIVAIVLTIILCIRYGQGTDYFAYKYLYSQVGNFFGEILKNSHGELIWRLSQSIFKQIGLNFEQYVFIVSAIMSYFTIRAIRKWSPYKCFSLLLLYPTFFLTYYLSAMRQGLVISIFLGEGINLLINKKYAKYALLITVLSLIHTSALILIVLPIIINIKNIGKGKMIAAITLIAIILSITGVIDVLYSSVVAGANYAKVKISVLAIIERILIFIIIYSLHRISSRNKSLKNEIKEQEIEELLYKIYKFGFVVFLVLSFTATLSQRLTAPMKAIEILLIPIILAKIPKGIANNRYNKKAILTIITIIILLTGELIKNTYISLEQGDYYENAKIYNVPITTIFNKEEINKYRDNKYKGYLNE